MKKLWFILFFAAIFVFSKAEDAVVKQEFADILDQKALMMEPFKVLSDWMHVSPVLVKGKILMLKIVMVVPGSPIAKSGIAQGMDVWEMQGVKARGLTSAEFNEAVSKALIATQQDKELRLRIVPGPYQVPVSHVIKLTRPITMTVAIGK